MTLVTAKWFARRSWSKNDATDADLLVASQQFDIASKSVRDTSVSMCKTTERPCASPLSEEEFEELKRSRFPKKTVDRL